MFQAHPSPASHTDHTFESQVYRSQLHQAQSSFLLPSSLLTQVREGPSGSALSEKGGGKEKGTTTPAGGGHISGMGNSIKRTIHKSAIIYTFSVQGMFQAHPRSVPCIPTNRLQGGAIADSSIVFVCPREVFFFRWNRGGPQGHSSVQQAQSSFLLPSPLLT